jgi:hypothetical protein
MGAVNHRPMTRVDLDRRCSSDLRQPLDGHDEPVRALRVLAQSDVRRAGRLGLRPVSDLGVQYFPDSLQAKLRGRSGGVKKIGGGGRASDGKMSWRYSSL